MRPTRRPIDTPSRRTASGRRPRLRRRACLHRRSRLPLRELRACPCPSGDAVRRWGRVQWSRCVSRWRVCAEPFVLRSGLVHDRGSPGYAVLYERRRRGIQRCLREWRWAPRDADVPDRLDRPERRPSWCYRPSSGSGTSFSVRLVIANGRMPSQHMRRSTTRRCRTRPYSGITTTTPAISPGRVRRSGTTRHLDRCSWTMNGWGAARFRLA